MVWPPAAPLARMATVSLVLVSPSIEMLLNDLEMEDVRRDWRDEGAMGASVHIIPNRVAMLGWIMPAPLVMPTRWYSSLEDGREKLRDRSLGKVSVVQIARAAESQCSWVEPREV